MKINKSLKFKIFWKQIFDNLSFTDFWFWALGSIMLGLSTEGRAELIGIVLNDGMVPGIYNLTHKADDQGSSCSYVILSDTLKKRNKSSDDELKRAMAEKDEMKEKEFLSDDEKFESFIENLEAAFKEIELPDSTDWNRAHQNLKEAMNHLKSESKSFKKDLSKAKIEMNKAIKRMQKQFQEFNEDELQDMKKELQKAIDEMKKAQEPEKPQLHKLDTIKL